MDKKQSYNAARGYGMYCLNMYTCIPGSSKYVKFPPFGRFFMVKYHKFYTLGRSIYIYILYISYIYASPPQDPYFLRIYICMSVSDMPYMATSTLWRLPSWPRHLHNSVPTRCATCFSIASRVFSTWHWTWSPPTWWPIASTWACAWRLMMVSWCCELLDSASSYRPMFFLQ